MNYPKKIDLKIVKVLLFVLCIVKFITSNNVEDINAAPTQEQEGD